MRTERRPRLWLTAVLLTAMLAGAGANATTYLQLTPDAMLTRADLVFIGTVADVSVADETGTPWTHVRFTVDTPLEGVPTGADGHASQPVELAFLGGTVPGGPALAVSGMPAFENGERVLVFAYHQPYASPIVGFRQGLWRVTPAGLQDEDGHFLAVGSGGELTSGSSGAALDAVVAAIRARLGTGTKTP